MTKEYGLLIYDVRQGFESLYERIYSKIGNKAIRLNLSCYLIPWGMRNQIVTIMEEVIASEETNGPTPVEYHVPRFDNRSTKELEVAADKAMAKMIEGLRKSVQKRVGKIGKDVNARKQYGSEIKKRLQNIHALLNLFALTRKFEGLYMGLEKLFVTELLVDVEKLRASQK